jgi:hypothetical protein
MNIWCIFIPKRKRYRKQSKAGIYSGNHKWSSSSMVAAFLKYSKPTFVSFKKS